MQTPAINFKPQEAWRMEKWGVQVDLTSHLTREHSPSLSNLKKLGECGNGKLKPVLSHDPVNRFEVTSNLNQEILKA